MRCRIAPLPLVFISIATLTLVSAHSEEVESIDKIIKERKVWYRASGTDMKHQKYDYDAIANAQKGGLILPRSVLERIKGKRSHGEIKRSLFKPDLPQADIENIEIGDHTTRMPIIILKRAKTNGAKQSKAKDGNKDDLAILYHSYKEE